MKTFVRVYNPHYGILYPWMLKINTKEELFEHEELLVHPQIKSAGSEYILNQGSHYTNTVTSVAAHVADITGKSFWEALGQFMGDAMLAKLNAIQKGCIYVNCNGGWFHWHEDLEERFVIEKDSLVWPDFDTNDIRIIQWPNGKHYYAKIGNLDVVWNGEQKWDTYEDAMQAALTYLT